MSEPVSITVESYRRDPRHREIADRMLAELRYDLGDVCGLRVGPSGRIEVDVVDRRSFTIRTDTYGDRGGRDE